MAELLISSIKREEVADFHMSNARAAIDNTKSIENNLKDLKKRKAEDNGIEVQEYLK
jgi:hypothetical protein